MVNLRYVLLFRLDLESPAKELRRQIDVFFFLSKLLYCIENVLLWRGQQEQFLDDVNRSRTANVDC